MSLAIVTAASDPAFYARVAFAALRVAQKVAEEKKHPNQPNRIAYVDRVLRGDDNAVLVAQHVAAASPKVAAALEKGGPEAPTDADIESTLLALWDARANAFKIHPIKDSPEAITE